MSVNYCILSQTTFTHYILFSLSVHYHLVFVILKRRYHSLCFNTIRVIEDVGNWFFITGTLKHCLQSLILILFCIFLQKSVHVFDCLDLVESWTVMPRAPSLLNQPRPHGVRQLLTCQQWTTPSSSQEAASLPLKPVWRRKTLI